MSSSIFEDGEFRILQGRGFTLVRKNKPYTYHSHFKHMDGTRLMIKLYYQKVIPYEPYFIEAMRRITTPEEFSSFRKQSRKCKYKNTNNRRR
ncbi:MAG: hypothetical protein K0S71_302 [Clostridia bacterium]|jgi:hypothetical protein|nr:hypothetical protein [Clostridia bacterium]